MQPTPAAVLSATITLRTYGIYSSILHLVYCIYCSNQRWLNLQMQGTAAAVLSAARLVVAELFRDPQGAAAEGEGQQMTVTVVIPGNACGLIIGKGGTKYEYLKNSCSCLVCIHCVVYRQQSCNSVCNCTRALYALRSMQNQPTGHCVSPAHHN